MWRFFVFLMIIIIVDKKSTRWTHTMMFCVFKTWKVSLLYLAFRWALIPICLLRMIMEVETFMQVQYFRLPRGSCKAVIKFSLFLNKLRLSFPAFASTEEKSFIKQDCKKIATSSSETKFCCYKLSWKFLLWTLPQLMKRTNKRINKTSPRVGGEIFYGLLYLTCTIEKPKYSEKNKGLS